MNMNKSMNHLAILALMVSAFAVHGSYALEFAKFEKYLDNTCTILGEDDIYQLGACYPTESGGETLFANGTFSAYSDTACSALAASQEFKTTCEGNAKLTFISGGTLKLDNAKQVVLSTFYGSSCSLGNPAKYSVQELGVCADRGVYSQKLELSGNKVDFKAYIGIGCAGSPLQEESVTLGDCILVDETRSGTPGYEVGYTAANVVQELISKSGAGYTEEDTPFKKGSGSDPTNSGAYTVSVQVATWASLIAAALFAMF